MAKVEIYLQ